jgi:type IV pilus assembly protein PilY1
MNRLSGFADSPFTNNTAKVIYGGDLWGNVWRFDTSTSPPKKTKLAQLFDAGGKPQSITTRPELAFVDKETVVYIGTGRYLGIEDLKDPKDVLPAPGWPFAYNNSMYAIKDKNNGADPQYVDFRNSGNVVENKLIDGGTSRTTTQNKVRWSTLTKWTGAAAEPVRDGWFVDLNPGGTSPGERVNIDPQLFLGTLAFVGNVPNNNVCTVGGDAWVYFLDFRNGTNVSVAPGLVAGSKVTGQTIVGFVVYQYGDPGGGGGGSGSGGSGSGGSGSGGSGSGGSGGGSGGGTGGHKCSYTGATGEKIFFECPVAGEPGTARRINWRELINRR